MSACGCWALGEPPDRIHRIFHARPLDGHPLGRRREARRIEPVEILRKVEDLAQADDQLVLVERACWATGIPGPADLEDKAAIGPKDAMDFLRERPKPLDVALGRHVAISLLPNQRERRRGHDQGNGVIRNLAKHIESICLVSLAERSCVGGLDVELGKLALGEGAWRRSGGGHGVGLLPGTPVHGRGLLSRRLGKVQEQDKIRK